MLTKARSTLMGHTTLHAWGQPRRRGSGGWKLGAPARGRSCGRWGEAGWRGAVAGRRCSTPWEAPLRGRPAGRAQCNQSRMRRRRPAQGAPEQWEPFGRSWELPTVSRCGGPRAREAAAAEAMRDIGAEAECAEEDGGAEVEGDHIAAVAVLRAGCLSRGRGAGPWSTAGWTWSTAGEKTSKALRETDRRRGREFKTTARGEGVWIPTCRMQMGPVPMRESGDSALRSGSWAGREECGTQPA